MQERSFSRKRAAAYVVTVGLLAVTVFFGKDGIDDFGESSTLAQRICSIAVMGYGVTAALALIGLFLRKGWALYAAMAWTLALTVAGTLAPSAWGDVAPAWWVTLVSALVIIAIGAGVTYLVRYLVTSSRAATSRT